MSDVENSSPRHETSPAQPTIAQVLDSYLAHEQARLKPRTYTRYAAVIDVLKDSLDRYGPNLVDSDTLDRYTAMGYDVAAEDPPFCELFGPAYISEHVDEFLSYFVPRKVIAGEEFLKTAGTVMQKLGKWLGEQGYIKPEEAALAQASGRQASHDLPTARRLAEFLNADTAGFFGDGNDIESNFEITRIGRDRVWLVDILSRRDYGPVKVGEHACGMCKVGWQIAGAIRRYGRGYRLVDAYNVYT